MISGNTELIINVIDNENIKYDKNGKRIINYKNNENLTGWLDMISGDSKYDYKAKYEDSTHVFICDYKDLSTLEIKDAKGKINNKEYDIKYIDDVMNLHEQLEIYLKIVDK